MNRSSAVLGIAFVLGLALWTGSVLLMAYALAAGSIVLIAGVLVKKVFRHYQGAASAQSNLADQAENVTLDGEAA
jgi:hypothetical protein